MENVITSLAKGVFIPFGLTATGAGEGTTRAAQDF